MKRTMFVMTMALIASAGAIDQATAQVDLGGPGDPQVIDVDVPTSEAYMKATERYEAIERRALERYLRASLAAKKAYLQQLGLAANQALQDGDIKEATALAEVRTRVESEAAKIEAWLASGDPPLLFGKTPSGDPDSDDVFSEVGDPEAQTPMIKNLGFRGFQVGTDRRWTYTKASIDAGYRGKIADIQDRLTADIRLLCVNADGDPKVLRYQPKIQLAQPGV